MYQENDGVQMEGAGKKYETEIQMTEKELEQLQKSVPMLKQMLQKATWNLASIETNENNTQMSVKAPGFGETTIQLNARGV